MDYSWMLSTLTHCLFVPQFGSCSSFGTFRPAFSHTATTRPLSVILPVSPTFNHSPGSNTPSPTSKVPSWKVCFYLQICLVFLCLIIIYCLLASCLSLPSFTLIGIKINLTNTILPLLIKFSLAIFPYNAHITYSRFPISYSTWPLTSS